ncbi:MAG: ATP-binding cassette domain-containing protein [Proteobacteria bacterium]|nr:ATP-binding cassette domain-containing protein [Pseudomonadota bacterium]MBU1736786.1 ATP-binding cassette domain-containing protein [Pseudomonadota bacterium]
MILVDLQEIKHSFGGAPLLDGLDLQIESGERVCLVGRNGEGKSTLLQIIAGGIVPDHGKVVFQQGLKVAMLSQMVPGFIGGTVYDVVAEGLGASVNLIREHQQLLERLTEDHDGGILSELAALEQKMDTSGAWKTEQRIETVLSTLQLNPAQPFGDLSGGMKRRVMLAHALVGEPDLLLLDEPTNHLDIDSIQWLEEFLQNSPCTLFFITHDRDLLKKLATRIIDLDRGRATSWPGDYGNYLRRKEEMLGNEEIARKKFDKKLAEEEVWVRRGVKARRTRDEGRVRELQEMRRQRAARREQLGRVRMEATGAGMSGKLVAVLKDVSYGYGEKQVVKNLTTTIMRGDRTGILGPNGAGKTTLLKLLLGELPPDSGEIKLGSNLHHVYFDQQRMQLDTNKTVIENLSDSGDFIELNGRRKHVIGYLGDFLFAPERARSPVSMLSGGEKNRLLLAKIFARPSNVLVLDEPTNDLDLETLELLEELLMEYDGTVLLVSHDRTFINNVVTSTLVFEGEGRVGEYAGGYDDWLKQRPSPLTEKKVRTEGKKVKPKTVKAAQRKLSFKENRELESLPAEIEALEKEQAELFRLMADHSLYTKGDGSDIANAGRRLEEIEAKLALSYARWEELEGLGAAGD